MKIKAVLTGLILLISFSGSLNAQVQFNGTLDLLLSAGGEDSKFIRNGINEDYKYLHFTIPQVNLLMFAPVNDNWFVEARLQSDTWGTGTLSEPRFTLANLTWSDPDKDYLLSFGRFINPVGFYSKRSLIIDRTFFDLPLSYSYFINISDERGLWPSAGDQLNYTSGDVGLSTIYFGGYATGVLFDWSIIENKLRLETALTNAAPASDANYTNLANAAFLSHLSYNPNIYWQFGLSASHGSFMQSKPVNAIHRPNNALEQYRQTLIGLDVTFGMAFVEIIAEGIYSHWKVPYYNNGSFRLRGNKLAEYTAENAGFNIDFRYEPPAFPGSYVAARFEHLKFFTAKADQYNVSSIRNWDEDISRISLTAGYKLARNVLARISVSDQTPFDQSLYTFRAGLSAFF